MPFVDHPAAAPSPLLHLPHCLLLRFILARTLASIRHRRTRGITCFPRRLSFSAGGEQSSCIATNRLANLSTSELTPLHPFSFQPSLATSGRSYKAEAGAGSTSSSAVSKIPLSFPFSLSHGFVPPVRLRIISALR